MGKLLELGGDKHSKQRLPDLQPLGVPARPQKKPASTDAGFLVS